MARKVDLEVSANRLTVTVTVPSGSGIDVLVILCDGTGDSNDSPIYEGTFQRTYTKLITAVQVFGHRSGKTLAEWDDTT